MNKFFWEHSVFTVEEFQQYMADKGSANQQTRKNLLTYHRNNGRIVNIRRGLYLVIPPGSSPESISCDLSLVAGKIVGDSVLAYHTALEFHGKAHSNSSTQYYLSRQRSVSLQFHANTFQSVLIPKALSNKGKEMFGVESHKRAGVNISVTNMERTFVDCLDRPELSGGWEEIWRSLEAIEFLKIDEVIEYVRLLNNATTAAKVGFFLEEHKNELMVGYRHLNYLKKLCPKKPHYIGNTRRRSGRLIKEWNIIVPESIINKTWEKINLSKIRK